MKPSVVAISPVATSSKLSWIQNSEDMVDQPSYSETHKLAIRNVDVLDHGKSHSAEFESANIPLILSCGTCVVRSKIRL